MLSPSPDAPRKSAGLERLLHDVRQSEPLPEAALAFEGFQILEAVGDGSFGTVYRAWDEKLEREVALKLLAPGPQGTTVRESLLREARALASVRHPNVLTIYGVLEAQGAMALSTEFVAGKNLATVLNESGPFAPREVLAVGIDLCRALTAVHAAGIVHRDVKTTNVLLEPSGRVVLADFGLGVRPSQPGEPHYRGVAGSPAFMAPEQVRGAEVDRRTDVYGLGVVLYNLLSRRLPHGGKDVEGVFESILGGGAPQLVEICPDAPPALSQVIHRALSRRPEDRFESAEAMADALRDIQTRWARASRKRRRVRVALLSAFAMGALGLAAWGALGDRLGGWLSSPDGVFHIQASLLLANGPASHALSAGEKVPPGAEVEVHIRLDRDANFYVLREDHRGRKYLIFPEPGAPGGSRLRSDVLHRLPRDAPRVAAPPDEISRRFWMLPAAAREEWLIFVASLEPIGPLEDALPDEAGAPTERGKQLRLKPVTLRGLHRRLGGLRGEADLESAVPNAKEVLAEELPALSGAHEEAEWIWMRRVEIAPES
jgi:serine/threonine-protein kinase